MNVEQHCQPHLQQFQSAAYPAVNLDVNGVKIAVCSADVDVFNQRSNADALWTDEAEIRNSAETEIIT